MPSSFSLLLFYFLLFFIRCESIASSSIFFTHSHLPFYKKNRPLYKRTIDSRYHLNSIHHLDDTSFLTRIHDHCLISFDNATPRHVPDFFLRIYTSHSLSTKKTICTSSLLCLYGHYYTQEILFCNKKLKSFENIF